jgi:hypothetical protein
MIFPIRIEIDRRYLNYHVEKIYDDGRIERYQINGKNGFIILESNRPLFRNRGLKKKRPEWNMIQGELKYRNYLRLFVDAIMDVVDK